jgi:hypothetical protein
LLDIFPKIEADAVSKNYGKFIIGPLESGYGVTLGNALRRVLLSSLPGAAVTSIKVDGVHHEFTPIPNAKEDTTQLILNVKQLRMKMHGDDGPLRLSLEARGRGNVTAADIQTPIKPGRYLARFYPDLASHEVRDLQESMPRAAKLHFAVTAADIERIYVTGPSSCMSREAAQYDGPCHPVRVYGESDLQLAYITNTAGVPTARALVWPEKKRHGRMYGHETLLAQALKTAGYEPDELTGARIRRIPVHGDGARVVMPYIDNDQSFDVVDNTWLSISGPYPAEATNGIAALSRMTYCQRCDVRIPEDSTYSVGDEAWCEDCRDQYTFISDFSGEEFSDDEQAEVVVCSDDGNKSTRDWSTSERDEHATYCSDSDQWYATNDFDFVTLANGDRWEASHFAEHGDPAELAPRTPHPDSESTPAPANDAEPIGTAERAA